jgi:hypothetical protein
MSRAACLTWVMLLALVGCGGGSASTGAGGSAGGAVTGAGGFAGASGRTGTSGSGGAKATGGTQGALPACALSARPSDPDAGVCNSIVITGGTLVAESVVGTSNGILLDAGTVEMPVGGTILDGDYDMVRWQDVSPGSTRRTMRVFGGGSYIEWAAIDLGSAPDGGDVEFRYDTTQHVMDTSLLVDSVDCTDGAFPDNFGFTASGDEVAFFNSTQGSVFAVDTYRRTCTRP